MIPFKTRERCPACRESGGQRAVFECDFAAPPISTYLAERYPALPMESLAGRKFVIMECSRCESLYHLEIIEDFYSNAEYKSWDGSAYRKKAKNRSLFYYAFHNNFVSGLLVILNALRDSVAVPKQVRLLDHGCGAGEFLAFARAYGLDAHGYDADPAKEKLLAEQGVGFLKETDLMRASGGGADCEPFDIISSNMVFEHLADPHAVFMGLAGLLAPNGVMRVSVPSHKNILAKIRNPGNWRVALKGTADTTNPIWPFGHRVCFSPKSMGILAEQAGLELIDPTGLEHFAKYHDPFPLKPILTLDGLFYFTKRD